MKKFIFGLVLALCLAACSIPCFAAYDMDDRDPVIYYGASAKITDEGAYCATLSQLGVNYNMSLDFYGSGIELICARYRNTGDFLVYIDGELQGTYNIGTTSSGYVNNISAFSVSDLELGMHSLSVMPVGSVVDAVSGYSTNSRVFVDKIVLSHDPVSLDQQHLVISGVIISLLAMIFTLLSTDFVFRRLLPHD